jgi:formylglycine-generating enzyme required for sulfatase activity
MTDHNNRKGGVQKGHAWREFALAPEMVRLPPGNYLMGENEEDKFANATERPRHRVEINYEFAICRYPITQGEFYAFDRNSISQPHLPAVEMSWLQAIEYCAWLGKQAGRPYRLPSEAEWEYACRAGSTSPFSIGNTITPEDANFLYEENGKRVGPGHSTAVGSYLLNTFGLGDMHGNVCEWVADRWHPNYQGAPSNGSAWLEGAETERRVIRGGAWDYLPRLLRSTWRDSLLQTVRRDNVGFRVALTL